MFMYRALPRFCEVLFAFVFLCIYIYIYIYIYILHYRLKNKCLQFKIDHSVYIVRVADQSPHLQINIINQRNFKWSFHPWLES